MLFVPHVPHPLPSPRARELARRIAAVIEEYRVTHPDLSRLELRQAIEEAISGSGSGSRRTQILVAVIAAMALAAGLLVAGRWSREPGSTFPVIAIGLFVALIALIVILRPR